MKKSAGYRRSRRVELGSPAFAADLAPAPYSKAPPPMIAAIYDWSGFYLGLNGGGGWSHNCWTNTSLGGVPTVPTVPKAAAMRPAAWPAARWDIDGRPGQWSSGRGPGRLERSESIDGKLSALPRRTRPVSTARSVHWPGWLRWTACSGTSGRRRGDLGPIHWLRHGGRPADRPGHEIGWGGTAGTVLESLRAELVSGGRNDHLFMVSGTKTGPNGAVLPLGTPTRTDSIRQDVDMVTARISYRWGGPVVAKYRS